MQARFNFRGAEEIEISTYPGGVRIEKSMGYVTAEEAKCPSCRALSEDGRNAGCSNDLRVGDLKPAWGESLSKSEARAVASAIMGAASEA